MKSQMLLYFQLRMGVTRIIDGQSLSVGVKKPSVSEKKKCKTFQVTDKRRKSGHTRHYHDKKD